MNPSFRVLALASLALLPALPLDAQTSASANPPTARTAPTNPFLLNPEKWARLYKLGLENQSNMRRQLGTTKLLRHSPPPSTP